MRKRRLFNDTGQPHGTVVLNWHGTPEKEFTYFATAFHQVAVKAVESLKKNPRFGLYGYPLEDFKAYPIVFLYRHCLELHMKAVIMAGLEMVRFKNLPTVDEKRIRNTHDLNWLREELEHVFEAYGWNWDLNLPHFRSLEDFRKIISELHRIDAGSFAFRYPIDKNGSPSLMSHFRFNVFEFCGTVDSLFPALEGTAIGAYEELQATLESMAEARHYELEYAEYEPPYSHDESDDG